MSKHGKRPTLKQKLLLSERRLNPDNWLVTKSLGDKIHIQHRESGRERIILLKGGCKYAG